MHPSVITWISAVVSEGICTLTPPNMSQIDGVVRLEEVRKVVQHMCLFIGFEISRLGVV